MIRPTPVFLLVGPFAGSFTPNARIPLDTGLCGAAATTGQTVVVDDVSKDPRYLSGSSMVNSEIVVPILVKAALAAELDVESYFAGTFDKPSRTSLKPAPPWRGSIWGKASLAEFWS